MSEKYKAFEQGAPYFITITIVEWLPIFQFPEFISIVIDSLQYCQKQKGLLIFGYCIMPSHLHLIVQSEILPLGSVIRDFKKHTSKQIAEIVIHNDKYQKYYPVFKQMASEIRRNKFVKVWMDGFHPEIIFSNHFFFQKLNYIHNNPVEAGLASKPELFLYSSARNYAGLEAPLEIIFETQQLISN